MLEPHPSSVVKRWFNEGSESIVPQSAVLFIPDGDTVIVGTGIQGTHPVISPDGSIRTSLRLVGIDAPEKDQVVHVMPIWLYIDY